MQLSKPVAGYQPRACDCDFCCKHGAAWLSDPDGELSIRVRDEAQVQSFRQGAELADFLLCRHCGVLVAVQYQEAGQRFAAVNARCMSPFGQFGDAVTASPKLLAAEEKTERWKRLWFRNVLLQIGR